MTGSDPTRDAAFFLLQSVLQRHRSLDMALDSLPAYDARDRTAGHRLAASVLRRFGSLNAVLEPHLRRAPPQEVMIILLMGTASLLLLNGPAHSSVGTAVDLARRQKLAPFAGLVNAVLRAVTRDGAATLADLDGPRLDTPGWLWQSWGPLARTLAQAQGTEAALDLTLRTGAPIPADGTLLPTGSVRMPAGTKVTALPGFAEGQFWVQDAAATLPARLLAAQPGEHVLDLCAAPGGKTAQLADAGATVTALDRDKTRLVRVEENLKRLQLSATLVAADAMGWQPEDGALFDAILLDAPCSATGTIRRHPDIPHLKRQKDIEALAEEQHKLIAAAASLLKPGGRLIYAVCSLQTEEGTAHLARVPEGLRHSPFTAADIASLPEALTKEGCVRTHPGLWPDKGGMDGFFIARFIRAA